jgi:hypothetical protein
LWDITDGETCGSWHRRLLAALPLAITINDSEVRAIYLPIAERYGKPLSEQLFFIWGDYFEELRAAILAPH